MTLLNPLLSYRFVVDIESKEGTSTVLAAGFSEVTGLEVEVETEEVQEGGAPTQLFPVRIGYPNLTLKRGLSLSSLLYAWTSAAANNEVERRNLRIFLLDSLGVPTWGWAVEGAYPVKWTGPQLQADQNTVAVESLELAHRGIRKMSNLPPERV